MVAGARGRVSNDLVRELLRRSRAARACVHHPDLVSLHGLEVEQAVGAIPAPPGSRRAILPGIPSGRAPQKR